MGSPSIFIADASSEESPSQVCTEHRNADLSIIPVSSQEFEDHSSPIVPSRVVFAHCKYHESSRITCLLIASTSQSWDSRSGCTYGQRKRCCCCSQLLWKKYEFNFISLPCLPRELHKCVATKLEILLRLPFTGRVRCFNAHANLHDFTPYLQACFLHVVKISQIMVHSSGAWP